MNFKFIIVNKVELVFGKIQVVVEDDLLFVDSIWCSHRQLRVFFIPTFAGGKVEKFERLWQNTNSINIFESMYVSRTR